MDALNSANKLSNYANLNSALQKLEKNRDQKTGSRITLETLGGNKNTATSLPGTASFQGRSVIKVDHSESWFVRLGRYLTSRGRQDSSRKAAAFLHDQVLLVLKDYQADIDIKKRIIRCAEKKALPFMSRSERREILQNRELTLCSDFEKVRIQEADDNLDAAMNDLPGKIPDLSLEQCRDFLESYYTFVLLVPERLHPGHPAVKFVQRMEKHFTSTRQPDGFQDLQNEVLFARLEDLKRDMTDIEYHDWLDRAGAYKEPLRDAALARAARKISRNALGTDLSIHGHPRDLVKDRDITFIEDLCNVPSLKNRLSPLQRDAIIEKWLRDKAFIANRLQEFSDEFKDVDNTALKQKLDTIQAMSPKELKSVLDNKDLPEADRAKLTLSPLERKYIAHCRKALLDIQLEQGRRWDRSILVNEQRWGISDKPRFEIMTRLMEVDQWRGPQVDEAQMEWMLERHDSVRKHPKVVIEGAGPTGLLAGLTQFIAGADVTNVEKRDTRYDRVQVVRLDPQWMNMLKFYLGEEYYQLFGGKNDQGEYEGFGVVRPDGFGEIATFRLEEALHDRLSKVQSYSDTYPADRGKRQFDRISAHELTSISKPDGLEDRFKVKAEYNPRFDPSNPNLVKDLDYRPPAINFIEADMLVCAGGKNSKLRNELMKDRPVTSNKPYGVCTWEVETCNTGFDEKTMDFKTFPDFRGMVVFDKEFQDHFSKELLRDFNDPYLSTYPPTYEERQIVEHFRISPDNKKGPKQQMLKKTRGEAMQTRCFENKGLIYIGMEIPDGFGRYLEKLEKELMSVPLPKNNEYGEPLSVDQLKEVRTARDQRVRKIVQHFQAAWFQSVANRYGLDGEGQKNIRCTREAMNRKYAAIFDVQQSRVKQNVVVQDAFDQGNPNELMVTAAGDAAASPHFMRYSGLTGARENILDLQRYTEADTGQRTDTLYPTHQERRQQLEAKSQKTADFVIQRGNVFLKRRPIWRIGAR